LQAGKLVSQHLREANRAKSVSREGAKAPREIKFNCNVFVQFLSLRLCVFARQKHFFN
jgi:hypothetical protein